MVAPDEPVSAPAFDVHDATTEALSESKSESNDGMMEDADFLTADQEKNTEALVREWLARRDQEENECNSSTNLCQTPSKPTATPSHAHSLSKPMATKTPPMPPPDACCMSDEELEEAFAAAAAEAEDDSTAPPEADKDEDDNDSDDGEKKPKAKPTLKAPPKPALAVARNSRALSPEECVAQLLAPPPLLGNQNNASPSRSTAIVPSPPRIQVHAPPPLLGNQNNPSHSTAIMPSPPRIQVNEPLPSSQNNPSHSTAIQVNVNDAGGGAAGITSSLNALLCGNPTNLASAFNDMPVMNNQISGVNSNQGLLPPAGIENMTNEMTARNSTAIVPCAAEQDDGSASEGNRAAQTAEPTDSAVGSTSEDTVAAFGTNTETGAVRSNWQKTHSSPATSPEKSPSEESVDSPPRDESEEKTSESVNAPPGVNDQDDGTVASGCSEAPAMSETRKRGRRSAAQPSTPIDSVRKPLRRSARKRKTPRRQSRLCC